MRCLLICILLSGILGSGCGSGIAPGRQPKIIDLVSIVEQSKAVCCQTMAYTFSRGGVERRTITVQADSRFPLPLQIPPRALLTFALAMPFNLGDGAVARMYFQSSEGEYLLAEHRMDPARKQEDRTWHEYSIDLTPYAGKQGRLVLQASSDTGDATGDWIGWGDLLLRRQ